jgi:hypothetical protein
LEVFDFEAGTWVPAPAPRDGRRVFYWRPEEAMPEQADGKVLTGDRIVDRSTGEVWVRFAGPPYHMTKVNLELSLNLEIHP